jgi:polyisoprenoid-binding protein YceI
MQAQEWELENGSSSCVVFGTSTLHDWEVEAEELKGSADFAIEDGVLSINSLDFRVVVEKLASGHSGMDGNTYKALKSETNPEIVYQFVRIISTEETTNGTLIKTGGKLTIAGKTRSIYLDVIARMGTKVSFSGETTFNMTDYDIEPPTAVMGTIKTGNEVTIRFNVQYSK